MIVKDIVSEIEKTAPLSFQESYDNSGLQIGNPVQEISKVLITLDVTESVVDEAIAIGAELILSHHPLIFGSLKRIIGANDVERCVIKAIQNNIAIYSAHTNLDAVITNGVNSKICEKIGLQNCRILSPKSQALFKLVTFIPIDYVETVRTALFDSGAGTIGNYDSCSFSSEGRGTFRARENTHPFVGEQGKLHTEPECRFEVIVPQHKRNAVVSALLKTHPYEEVAYDLIPLANDYELTGAGMIGELPTEKETEEFLNEIKQLFQTRGMKYTQIHKKAIKKIAVCGGSGSFLIADAIKANADIFITGDVKYHDFFRAERKVIIVDIGHYESEQYTKELFYEIINKKFPKFAVHFSKISTNPINYL